MDPEHGLVSAAQRGDLEAFSRLIQIHQERIYALAVRMTRNHHDAEDITQETFILAYRKLKGFRGKSSLGTWLHRIAVNLCLSRARKKRPSELDEEMIPRIPDRENRTRIEVQAQANQLKESLASAVAKLPPRQRMCFLLRTQENLKYREVSRLMKCKEGTAKALYHQALGNLRKDLSAYVEESHAI